MRDFIPLIISALGTTSGAKTPPAVLVRIQQGEDVDLDDLRLDSLDRFEVMMYVEEQLGIELDEDDLTEQKTVHGLLKHLATLIE